MRTALATFLVGLSVLFGAPANADTPSEPIPMGGTYTQVECFEDPMLGLYRDQRDRLQQDLLTLQSKYDIQSETVRAVQAQNGFLAAQLQGSRLKVKSQKATIMYLRQKIRNSR